MVSSTLIDGLFNGALDTLNNQRSVLAQTAISNASDRTTKKDYEGAIQQLKRAIALDPRGDYASQAYDLMGSCYEQLGKPDEAAKAYQAMGALDTTSDAPHLRLGKLYFGEQKYDASQREYEQAVKLSPTSAANLLSLGHAYLSGGRLTDAEKTFRQVVRMQPAEHGSHYALGQALAKEGRYDEAVSALETTLSLKHDFDAARVDLGQTYAAMGRFDAAKQQLSALQNSGSTLAPLLQASILKAEPARIKTAGSTDGFIPTLGPGALLSWLDPAVAQPGGVKEFSLSFFFSKAMDETSVETVTNWSINRTLVGSPSGAYNNAQPLPPTEAGVSPIPTRIEYDASSDTARVFFTLRQNAEGTATLDPSHLIFRFMGLDAYGNAMDPGADQFNAISLIT